MNIITTFASVARSAKEKSGQVAVANVAPPELEYSPAYGGTLRRRCTRSTHIIFFYSYLFYDC